MGTAQTNEYDTLHLSRTFNAPCNKVYGAWTNAGILSQWFAPSDQMKTEVLELDVRVGGRYRIRMEEGENDCEFHIVGGEYLSIVPNKKLIFTWQWEDDDSNTEMLLTLKFIDKGDTTDFLLTHERILDQETRDSHNEGWTSCLARLGTLLSHGN